MANPHKHHIFLERALFLRIENEYKYSYFFFITRVATTHISNSRLKETIRTGCIFREEYEPCIAISQTRLLSFLEEKYFLSIMK